MKKIFLLVIVSLLIVSASVPTAFASDKTDKEEIKVDQIGKHTLEIIDKEDLPDGVVPIEFNSREEAKLYLDNLEEEANRINKESALAASARENTISSNSFTVVPLATTYYNGSGSKDHSFCGGLHYVRVRCLYTYYYHPTTGTKLYKSCDSVTSSNQGYTLDSSWTQNSYTASLEGRYIGVNVYGTMKHYLFINGLIEVSSTEYNFYDEF